MGVTYFKLWTYHGVIDRIHHAFYLECRERLGREASHGCSTLLDFEQFEEWLQSSECGAVSVLLERFGAICHEDVESEAAHAREHAWVGSDARSVLTHGNVTAVVGDGLDGPVCADGLGGARGGDFGVGDVEGGFSGVVPLPGAAVAGEDLALNTDNGGEVRAPVGIEQGADWLKDGDDTALVAVSALVAAAV